jgi:hypothetical protein
LNRRRSHYELNNSSWTITASTNGNWEEADQFIIDVYPSCGYDELKPRYEEIEEIYGISLEVLTFEEWIEEQFEHALTEETVSEQELAVAWMTAYTESLAQQRREIAPIDEPCYQWLLTLKEILTEDLPDASNH